MTRSCLKLLEALLSAIERFVHKRTQPVWCACIFVPARLLLCTVFIACRAHICAFVWCRLVFRLKTRSWWMFLSDAGNASILGDRTRPFRP